ncbi:MAG: hypothetical protein Q4F50_05705 [Bacteroides sp.]|uniref:DUF6562 domain-containing protein n=1 Tax=Bacteroides sp. TaxID=29523 RepID=UPI0026E080DB|nr:DUF6562 domain-containing protein [Bacteroides sp.]MDO5419541.1 hypothetical protein [Bacteroides sp.]
MKKYKLYLLLAALVGLTASCSKDAEESGLQTTDNSTVSIGASIDPGVSTRAGGDYTVPDGYKLRYVLEVWSTGANAAVVYRNEQTVTEIKGVDFTFKLEKAGNYQALLWADFIDKNASASEVAEGSVTYTHYADMFYYTRDNQATSYNLKKIGLSKDNYEINNEARDAFSKCMDIKKETGAYNDAFELNRPFGQINIIEKNASLITDVKTIKLTYKVPETFDVSTGTPGEALFEVSPSTDIKPTPTDSRKANLAYDYIFARTTGQLTLGEIAMTFTPTAEASATGISFPDFTIPANMPVERNRRTNISGHILEETSSAATLSVSLSTGWDDVEDDIVLKVKIGDYYYKDGTWSSELNPTTENPVIGVVFKVNADGKTGSVVSLTEPTGLAWAVEGHENATGATELYDGKANTAKVFAYISENGENITNYPIFAACQTQRTETGNDGWYIPEFYVIYEILTQINAKIAAAGGTEFVSSDTAEEYYWTSRESKSNATAAMRSDLKGNGISVSKDTEYKVRFFLDF